MHVCALVYEEGGGDGGDGGGDDEVATNNTSSTEDDFVGEGDEDIDAVLFLLQLGPPGSFILLLLSCKKLNIGKGCVGISIDIHQIL